MIKDTQAMENTTLHTYQFVLTNGTIVTVQAENVCEAARIARGD